MIILMIIAGVFDMIIFFFFDLFKMEKYLIQNILIKIFEELIVKQI